MAVSNLIVLESEPRDLVLSDELISVTRGFMLEARSESTRRAYARGWSCFETWCRAQGRSALPASPEKVLSNPPGIAPLVQHEDVRWRLEF